MSPRNAGWGRRERARQALRRSLEAAQRYGQGLGAATARWHLARLDEPLVVPELATFNVELNGAPQSLEGDALTRLYRDLRDLWARCAIGAEEMSKNTGSDAAGALKPSRNRCSVSKKVRGPSPA